MELHIIEDDLICNIQQAFRESYPCLDLQFYPNPYRADALSGQPEQLDHQSPIAEITMFHTGGAIDISPERCLAGVEADFFHKFGLCVRIIRQAGDLATALAGTHNPTLQQLNDSGLDLTMPVNSGAIR